METYMFRIPPVVSVAIEVIAGKYGVDSERKTALEREGYDYNKVQNCVNELVALMEKYGGE